MLLAIDSGNTNTVFAVFNDAGEIVGQWRAAAKTAKTADELAVWLRQLMALEDLGRDDIDEVIIATVVPENLFDLRTLAKKYFDCTALVVGDENVELGIEVHVDRPGEVGADRLVNTVSAHATYGGPLIVVDFGTATTFDVVSGEGAYEGGVIAPGVNLSLEALQRAAAKLPRIDIGKPRQVIGTNTITAMQSGIYYGYASMIEGVITRIREELNVADLKVIATGGLAKLYTSACPSIDDTDNDLTLRGLYTINKLEPGMSDELLFLPLGGAGEIGMNLNLYGLGDPKDPTWLMIDLGVTFGDGSPPGVDLITPDPSFIEDRRDRLAGLVLTHAHEDHLGAVPYLWDRIRCPIYATPFTMEILKRKLSETDFGDEVELHEVPLDGAFKVGPFDLDLITLTHSIPEPNGIAIKTPLGTILHTGDWKFDPDPVIGEVSDEAALNRLGDDGVLAIVCDSTNVFSPGHSGSEADLAKALTDIIDKCEGKVAVACFATNVARLHTVAKAAEACGRDVILAGRSLQRTTTAARNCGYMDDVAPFLDEEASGFIPDDRQLIICTGSQGEPRAALARIATDSHPRISMGKGDTVIFSSRVIPGNEVGIGTMKNNLARLGVRIVEDSDAHIHVSGHPNQEELIEMYQHVRPQISIPVHGERRHLERHAALARECQVVHAIVNENGGMIRLAPGTPEIIDHVPSGRLAYDGNRMIPMQGEAMRSRVQGLWNGTAVVTICINKDGRPQGDMIITTTGLLEPDEEDTVLDQVADDVYDAIERLSKRQLQDDEEVSETVRLAARRGFRRLLDKKPITDVHLIRI